MTHTTRVISKPISLALLLFLALLLGCTEDTPNPIDLAMGHFNCIWQGDANERILRALGHCTNPPQALNITGPDTLSVRDVAGRLGQLMNRQPKFTGEEAPTVWLNNPARSTELFGEPTTKLETLLRWTAHWTLNQGRSLGKPTHFEVRDGKY